MKRQRNDIFEVLVRNGLGPAVGVNLDDAGDSVLSIQHRHSKSLFSFWRHVDGGGFNGTATVGLEDHAKFNHCRWDQLLAHIGRWAREVRDELDAPDLWEELKNSSWRLAELDDELADNRLFTPDEQLQISGRLDAVKEYVRDTYQPSDEQMEHIGRRLDELEEASKRVGRKDWKVMVMGTVFGLAATDLVPPSAVHAILAVLLHGIAHILGVGGGPPPIPPQT